MTIGEAVRRSSAVAGAEPTTSVAAVTAAMPAPAMRRWNDMVLRFWSGRRVGRIRAPPRVCGGARDRRRSGWCGNPASLAVVITLACIVKRIPERSVAHASTFLRVCCMHGCADAARDGAGSVGDSARSTCAVTSRLRAAGLRAGDGARRSRHPLGYCSAEVSRARLSSTVDRSGWVIHSSRRELAALAAVAVLDGAHLAHERRPVHEERDLHVELERADVHVARADHRDVVVDREVLGVQDVRAPGTARSSRPARRSAS